MIFLIFLCFRITWSLSVPRSLSQDHMISLDWMIFKNESDSLYLFSFCTFQTFQLVIFYTSTNLDIMQSTIKLTFWYLLAGRSILQVQPWLRLLARLRESLQVQTSFLIWVTVDVWLPINKMYSFLIVQWMKW